MKIDVNGSQRDVEADADMPLLWVLRDLLGLPGTKYGCGMAQCGACTVHIDGSPVRSCVTPVGTVGARKVTTIEGISSDGSHVVQRAWAEHADVACTRRQQGPQELAVAIKRMGHDHDMSIACSVHGRADHGWRANQGAVEPRRVARIRVTYRRSPAHGADQICEWDRVVVGAGDEHVRRGCDRLHEHAHAFELEGHDSG